MWRGILRHRFSRNVLAAVASLALILLAWQAAIDWFHVPSYVACTPLQAIDAIRTNWSVLSPLVFATVRETFYGFAAGTASGLALAVLMSRFHLFERLTYPVLITSQAIPIVALAPILVLIFNFTLTPIVIVVALFVFFPITINTLGALKSVDRDLLGLTRVLGAKRWRTLVFIELPSALPAFLSGLRIGGVYAVSGAILAQLYDTTTGSLAVHQSTALSSFQTPEVYGDTLLMTAMSLLWFLLVVWIGYLATPWLRRSTAPRWPWRARTDPTD
jgi:ABC-type nitrate/sulfonate/bicarbonate transport system permease component